MIRVFVIGWNAQQVRVEMVAMKRDAEHYGLVPQPRPKKLGIQWSDHDGLRTESNEWCVLINSFPFLHMYS